MGWIVILLYYESQGKAKSNIASEAGAFFDRPGFDDHVYRSRPAVLDGEPRGILRTLNRGGEGACD